MMRLHRVCRGWRFALLLVGGWIGLVFLWTALESHAEGAASNSRIERWNKASREEHRAMRAAAHDFWEHASPAKRKWIKRRLQALHRALPEFSKRERRMILRRTFEMPEAERKALRDRIMKIEELDRDARAALEADLRAMLDSQSDEMNRIEKNAQRWKRMSAEEHEEMRAQMRQFRKLSVDERRRLLDEWMPSGRSSTRPHHASEPRDSDQR